jgi:hypothetical protein
MNCVNCGGKIATNGCTCTSNDLLKRIELERINDDFVNEAREEISSLKRRLLPIHVVWTRWKDSARSEYLTIEDTEHALYDFEKAIQKAMIGYEP